MKTNPEAKHTPGNWAVNRNVGRKSELGIVADDAPCVIAIVTGEAHWPAIAQANARLIAAAPELLSQLDRRAGNLETLALYLQLWLDNGATKPERADTPTLKTMIEAAQICAKEARAVAAKAKGEA